MENSRRLLELMEQYAQSDVCLAFSGGVDSSLLLKLACEQAQRQGTTVHAVTFDTRLHPPCDLENARRVADELNAVHHVIRVDELELKELRDNPPNRCYLCKRHLFGALITYAAARGIPVIMDGTNEDDLHVYRPGIRALGELGIVSPLALSHMTKSEVKAMASRLGLSAASRPSTPCMATRLPYGETIDYKVLERIEQGEAYLRQLLGGNIRLRLHRDVARIEADRDVLAKAVDCRAPITRELKRLGFRYITLDLEGFRSGSMDLYLDEAAEE